ncbi:MAG TPA: hypothetical protein VGU22_06720 [Methylomirabilota bacterium]|jgi:hypothetical protein|nr:hypothetical protein [Methylomirabilota bacterium]
MKGILRALLSAYVAGEIDRETFENWLIPATWDERRLSPEVLEMVDAIQLSLAEFLNGDVTEDELKNDFRALMGPEPIIIPAADFKYPTRRSPVEAMESRNRLAKYAVGAES